jgi:hypothetical protein
VKNNSKNKFIPKKKMGYFFFLAQFMEHIYLHFGPYFFVKFIFSYKTLCFYILIPYNVKTREKIIKKKQSFAQLYFNYQKLQFWLLNFYSFKEWS